MSVPILDRDGVGVGATGQRRHLLGFLPALALIGLAALVSRVAYTLISHGADDRNLFNEGDAFYYATVAENLVAGKWFVNLFSGVPVADHPPLTVLVLAPAAHLFPRNVLALRLTMSIIGVLVVVVVGLAARELAGRRAGLVAAVVALVNPNLWMNDALVMSESISALLICLLVWSGIRLARDPTTTRAAVSGALCGLTVLARAEVGLFLPFMIVPILVVAGTLGWAQRLGRMALAAGLTVAVIAPWALWNLSRFEDPVLVSTNDGTTLVGANCPETYESGLIGSWSLRCVLGTFDGRRDASEDSSHQRSLAFDYARDHLGSLPKVIFAREGRTFGFWRPDQYAYANRGEGRPRTASWAGYVFFWILVPVGVVGLAALRRRGTSVIPFCAALVTVIVVSAAFYGIPRFRLPVDVALCLLAGAAFAADPNRGTVSPEEEPS